LLVLAAEVALKHITGRDVDLVRDNGKFNKDFKLDSLAGLSIVTASCDNICLRRKIELQDYVFQGTILLAVRYSDTLGNVVAVGKSSLDCRLVAYAKSRPDSVGVDPEPFIEAYFTMVARLNDASYTVPKLLPTTPRELEICAKAKRMFLHFLSA
jgi:acyl-CoA hydrolase